MMQLKAIFSVLLRDWTFELAQPSDSYRNDHSKMVVQLAQPCVVRYRRRSQLMRIEVDLDLCQGHANCELEAPGVFSVPKKGLVQILDQEPPESERAAVTAAVRYCPAHGARIKEQRVVE